MRAQDPVVDPEGHGVDQDVQVGPEPVLGVILPGLESLAVKEEVERLPVIERLVAVRDEGPPCRDHAEGQEQLEAELDPRAPGLLSSSGRSSLDDIGYAILVNDLERPVDCLGRPGPERGRGGRLGARRSAGRRRHLSQVMTFLGFREKIDKDNTLLFCFDSAFLFGYERRTLDSFKIKSPRKKLFHPEVVMFDEAENNIVF